MDMIEHYGTLDRFLMNAFCATGPGGGVDPTCGKGDEGNITEWMKGSHKSMFDDSGNPREFFHGTAKDFTKFSPSTYGAAGPGVYLSTTKGKAVSFADREGGKVLTVVARLKNPLRVPYNETSNIKEWVKKAHEGGHDGLLIPGQGEVVVFNPSDVRIEK